MLSVGTPFLWSFFAIFVVVALAVDFLAMARQGPHAVSLREAGLWSLAWIIVALLFVVWFWWYLGGTSSDEAVRLLAGDKALEFLTGYVIEKALAVDNIFVFLILFNYFKVPLNFQKRALMLGIIGAIFLRAIMILIGAWLVAEFHFIMYLFGAFLLFTGIKMWWASDQDPDMGSNPVLRWMSRHLRISPDYDGERMTTRINGVRMVTPMFVVVMLIGVVDVIFAVDSIPAIFAITIDPFIVLSSNVFAILGLRAMFFLLASMQDRFHLLPYGLSIVLVLIGLKMLLMDIYEIPVAISLGLTVIVLAATMLLSLRIAPKHETDESQTPGDAPGA